MDQDRLLYHFLVEGTVIKDGSKVQCDVSVRFCNMFELRKSSLYLIRLIHIVHILCSSVNCAPFIPPQSTLGVVTCIAWKGDLLVLSDVDGNLSIWELKARITR